MQDLNVSSTVKNNLDEVMVILVYTILASQLVSSFCILGRNIFRKFKTYKVTSEEGKGPYSDGPINNTNENEIHHKKGWEDT